MKHLLTCKIPFHSIAYDIEIGCNLLLNQSQYLHSLASKFVIISDDHVAPLYALNLQKNLESFGLIVYLLVFEHGEENKNRLTKEKLEDQLIQKELGRDTCILALGGGVVSDIAGYLAATYCRGIPFVTISTSLLGMVDASIGGKTGVNVPGGKNMVGCIYQPKKVVIDIDTLKTLPKNELLNGFVEIIKHALIADDALFEELEKHSERLLNLDISLLTPIIYKSCLIKKEIVEQDEKELGKRRLLNFGHTIGHALEKQTNYFISHGEAVAIGIIVESFIALNLGHLNQHLFERIKQIFLRYHLALKLPPTLSIQKILETMKIDKKSLQSRPRFVIIESIGSCLSYDFQYCTYVENALIEKALQWMIDDLCGN